MPRINLVVQDAVAIARLLAKPLRAGSTYPTLVDALSPDQVLETEEADRKLGELLPRHLVGRAHNRAMFDHGLDLLIEEIRSHVHRASG